MDIGPDCRISFSAKLDKSYPAGVHIGESTAINFGACVLTHDYPRRLHLDTWIGKECQIGAHSIIMPGVRVGDNCVVAVASVVMKDVPPKLPGVGKSRAGDGEGHSNRAMGHHQSHGATRFRDGFVRA